MLNRREISECLARFLIFASMSSREQKFTASRVRSSYISVVISMTLVLFTMGTLGMLLTSARTLSDAVRENFTFTLVLSEDIPETELRALVKQQQLASYTKSAELVTKEDAAASLQEDLGEDFVDFLGYNPLSNTIDLHLSADFVANEDLDALREELLQENFINEVLYDPDLIALVNDNIQKISMVLVGAAAVLLVVALALINSSIRLSIYAKRFLLKTMQLVGATPAFIRRPYILNSLLLGAVSGALSVGMLFGIGLALQNYYPALAALFTVETAAVVMIGVFIFGLLVPGISTAIAIRRYLKLRTNELYF